MDTLEPYLREHPFLQGMKDKHIQLIVGCASNVKFEAGQYLDRQGEPADHFWILRHGKVAIELYDPVAGPICIQTIGEGEVVGWSWLFPPYMGHYDSRAVELSRAIALDAKCLRQKCEEDNELGFDLFKRFAMIMEQRLEATRVQLLDLYK